MQEKRKFKLEYAEFKEFIWNHRWNIFFYMHYILADLWILDV